MKNLARTLAVILLSVTSAAWAADEPAPPVPAGETANVASAPASAQPASVAPDSLPPAPSIPSEAKTTAPAPKAPPVEPPVKIAVPTTKQPSVRELPAIVVTESKIAQPQDSVTQSVRVLYAEDIAERPENQRNLSELLRYEPGVFILPLSRNDANWGSYGGQGPKYNVHLLDGLPVDSFVDDMSLDAWAFERVESHRGPAEDLRRARLPGRRVGGAQQPHQQEVRPALEFPGSGLQWDGLRAGSDVAAMVRAPILASIVCAAALPITHGAAAAASDTADARPVPRVVIELFQVTLGESASLRYVRRVAALDGRGPDATVAELLRGSAEAPSFFDGNPAIVHSTSWRYEEGGTVVLTYLAYGEKVKQATFARKDTRTILQKDLPGIGVTDPDKPRPPSLAHEDVLAHGLRHLALLARRAGGDKFALRLGERSRRFFSYIEPELAGEIGGSNMLVPSSTGAR
jgi:hypothetical protein